MSKNNDIEIQITCRSFKYNCNISQFLIQPNIEDKDYIYTTIKCMMNQLQQYIKDKENATSQRS